MMSHVVTCDIVLRAYINVVSSRGPMLLSDTVSLVWLDRSVGLAVQVWGFRVRALRCVTAARVDLTRGSDVSR